MKLNELRKQILCLFEEQYKKRYTGHIWIKELQPVGYEVKLGINNDDKPLVISAELPYNQFLQFIKKEIHDRRMDFVKYFMGYKIYPDQCNNINKSCNERCQR